MRKRYCINVNHCVGPTILPPLIWSVFLAIAFLVVTLIASVRGEGTEFLESIPKTPFLWVLLIVFPANYAELEKESVRIHKPFKKDCFIRYDEIRYIRLRPFPKMDWLFVYFFDEALTMEMRKDPPKRSFWFSSSPRLYEAMAEKVQAIAEQKHKAITREKFFTPETRWVEENGNPMDFEWGEPLK